MSCRSLCKQRRPGPQTWFAGLSTVVPAPTFTPHERGPEPVVSIAFCDMSQNVTKRRLTQPVVVFSPVVESENLKSPKSYITKPVLLFLLC